MKAKRKLRRTPSGLKRKKVISDPAAPPLPLMISESEMTPEKRKALEDAGWKIGDTDEFLGG
jgi:hypothetical protein